MIVKRHAEAREFIRVRLHHYETVTEQKSREVPDGGHYEYSYHDNGDGTFSEEGTWITDYRTEYYTETHEEPVYREEPVYDTKYTYTIWHWQYDRTVNSSAHDKEPVDGEYTLDEHERADAPVTDYRLVLMNDDKTYDVSVDKDFYMQTDTYTTVEGRVSLGRFYPKTE